MNSKIIRGHTGRCRSSWLFNIFRLRFWSMYLYNDFLVIGCYKKSMLVLWHAVAFNVVNDNIIGIENTLTHADFYDTQYFYICMAT